MAEIAEEQQRQNEEESTPLGERLIEKGVLSEDQLRIALLEHQANPQDPLGRVLIRMGFLTEATLRDIFAESSRAQSVDLQRVTVAPEVLEKVPMDVAKRYNVFPLFFDAERNVITLAVANPNDIVLLDQIRAFLGGEIDLEFRVAEESEIDRAVDEYYGLELTIDGILREIEMGETNALEGGDTAANPIIRLVNAFLNDAVKRGASDIHFEPEASFLRVRYRIDGVLRQIRSLHRSYWDGMAVRLKVISEMNIAESRAPQDGRISFTLYGREIDLRVAAQPTVHGENFVLRILDRQRNIARIDKLGLSDRALRMLKLITSKPTGVLMVTGPTGSGKTTTLYSIISHINNESVNIMTLEDPVEYPLPMIRQSAVSEGSKMGWSAGVRSILRQDPDVVLIGEVRDTETATMAFRAAMTGHQVLTTLHTNTALGVLPRLRDMGIPNTLLSGGNISGIVAQRLVRRLCPRCKKKKVEFTEDERQIVKHFVSNPDETDIFELRRLPSVRVSGLSRALGDHGDFSRDRGSRRAFHERQNASARNPRQGHRRRVLHLARAQRHGAHRERRYILGRVVARGRLGRVSQLTRRRTRHCHGAFQIHRGQPRRQDRARADRCAQRRRFGGAHQQARLVACQFGHRQKRVSLRLALFSAQHQPRRIGAVFAFISSASSPAACRCSRAFPMCAIRCRILLCGMSSAWLFKKSKAAPRFRSRSPSIQKFSTRFS